MLKDAESIGGSGGWLALSPGMILEPKVFPQLPTASSS